MKSTQRRMGQRYSACLLLLLVGVSCIEERIIYADQDSEQGIIEEPTYVSANVVTWSVTHRDGEPFVSASGKVKNHGPKNVQRVRVWVGSNYGDMRVAASAPPNLDVGDIGTWQVSSLEGTYIRDKNVTFDEISN